MLLKSIIWKDRNLLFALIHQGITYFIFFGFFDIFSIYCVTVLGIYHELFLSNVYCLAMFAVFVYVMFGIDVDFFERTDEPRIEVKMLLKSLMTGLLSLIMIYFLRFCITFNSYVFLVIVSGTFMFFTISAAHIIG